MSNPYFTKSGYPSTSARAVSASLRAEIANIETGFDKLPTLSGNGSKVIAVNAGATALEASSAPNIGAATATSINGVAITGTGTIASGGGISSAPYSPTLADVSNTSSRTLNGAFYIRVAGYALVAISFSSMATAGGQATIDATLPFAPDVSGAVDVIGVGSSLGGGFTPAAVTGISSSKAQITWDASGNPTTDNLYVLFIYPIA